MTNGVRGALADTSVLIAPPTEGWSAVADEVAVSIVSVAELQYGVYVGDPLQAVSRRRLLELVSGSYEILPLDLPTTELYGALAGMVQTSGRNPRPRRFDLLIAATAARHQLVLLTRHQDGFVGLERAVRVVQVQ